ncbi:hypothetical protein [Dokdonia pacifica]|nr:hypothetical protein [Dokdonia pacifica]
MKDNQAVKQSSKGAKMSLKKNINGKLPSKSLEEVLSIILGLENDKSRWKLVANSGERFENAKQFNEIVVAKNVKTFGRNFEEKHLTHKVLGAIICYIFEKFSDSQIINNKLHQLFHLIEINEGTSYFHSINTLIKHHIIQRKNQEDKQLRNNKNYSLTYPKDWAYEIDVNWKSSLSVYPAPNNQVEIQKFISQIYTLGIDDEAKPKKLRERIQQFIILPKDPKSYLVLLLLLLLFLLAKNKFSNNSTNSSNIENNGIKNEFYGDVEKVNFIEEKEKVEL